MMLYLKKEFFYLKNKSKVKLIIIKKLAIVCLWLFKKNLVLLIFPFLEKLKTLSKSIGVVNIGKDSDKICCEVRGKE